MDLPTLLAVIVVTLVISAIGATAGYYLQRRLRRLEELEQRAVALSPPTPPPSPVGLAEKTKPFEVLPDITASLTVTTDPQAGQRFVLGINTLIGRSPGLCDIVLSDNRVSRQHAKIRQEEEQFYIYDLGTTNGTRVNNQLIHRAELHDGDKIGLGNTELVFKIESDEQASKE